MWWGGAWGRGKGVSVGKSGGRGVFVYANVASNHPIVMEVKTVITTPEVCNSINTNNVLNYCGGVELGVGVKACLFMPICKNVFSVTFMKLALKVNHSECSKIPKACHPLLITDRKTGFQCKSRNRSQWSRFGHQMESFQ